jgi:glycosyltransferase involved in cell wall biosynthesis
MRVTDPWADAVTAVSALVAKARIEARTTSEDKITVIPNGVDPKRFARPEASALELLRQRFRFSAEDRVLLCVGRLEPEKNHVLLLRVFARLRAQFPQLKLLLAGSGRLESELRALAGELGVRDEVVFAGQVAPVAPLFHLAEWFVLASSLEGLPMVVLEAMAARLPMIVTQVGGIPEVIEDGRTGWLVPPCDEAAFESALVHALRLPPGERARVAEAAHCEVERRFSVRGMVEATEALYERLLGEATRAGR